MQTIDERDAASSVTAASRQLLKRVVSSTTFGRAERLSTLLTYLCEQTLEGHAAELNEQHVGEAVFGRARGYDCSIDGIVRTQASRLRQRLTAYFAGEGLWEPVRITIPPGGYVPTFEPRPPASPPVNDSDERAPGSPADLPREQTRPTRKRIAAIALVVVVVVVVAVAVATISALLAFAGRGKTAPGTNPLWAELFPAGATTLVVPGDSSLVIWQSMMHRTLTLPEYTKGSYLDSSVYPDSLMRDAAIGSGRYTSIVDLDIVRTLASISERGGASLSVRYTRDVRPNDLKRGNAILIGAPEANPWVRLFDPNLNFVPSVDRAEQRYVVLNRKPRPPEPSEWTLNDEQARSSAFALVAYLPNFDGEGNVLIVEGSSMAGTECAWDFVNDKVRFLPFLKSIRPSGVGPLPHFEVLLTSQNVSGSATRGTVVAFRRHP